MGLGLHRRPLLQAPSAVPARRWYHVIPVKTHKKDWEDAKKKDGIWKDVRVYDSTMLIQWIISVPPVDIWYSQLIGMPSSNLVAGSDRLKELLEWQDIALDASFYTTGREEIALQLMELIKKPTIRAYRA